MKMIGKLKMEDIIRWYELGHQKLFEFLSQGKNLEELCAAIDSVMPENINMWLNTIPGGNPLVLGQKVQIDNNTMLLLHHTAHFFMTVSIGMAIDLELLDDSLILWDKSNGKVS